MTMKKIANERGMLLVIVMVMLLVISSIAGASLVNSMLERSLARNQNYATNALQAAEAGLADGVAWLNANKALIPNASPWSDTADWPKEVANGRAIVRDLTRDMNGDGDTTDDVDRLGSYTVSMRFKREWYDYNGSGNCTDPGESSGYHDSDGSPAVDCPGDIVLFNRGPQTSNNGFGFPGSLWLAAGEGYPVIEIDAVGRYGNAAVREIVLDVARNKLLVKAFGAVTASSGVNATGNIDIDGRAHDEQGRLCTDPAATCSCTVSAPGVVVDAGHAVTSGGSSALSGDPGPSDNTGAYGATPKSPDEALGLNPGDLATLLGGLPAAGACKTLDTVRYASTMFLELAGVPSTLLIGWVSDRCSGRRGMVSLLCMIPIFFAFLGIMLNPPGNLWLDMVLMGIVGFFVYPPVMLLGVAALDLTSKKAVGTAAGFVGLFGYLGSMAQAQGIGYLAEHYGWPSVFYAILGCTVMAIVLLAFTWNIKPRG
jgi:type II secretory pathway pseudopilin PulG